MDRLHQHTAQCTTCSAALEKTRTAQKGERFWSLESYSVFFEEGLERFESWASLYMVSMFGAL
jgi:hypothetical protein